MQDFEKLGIFYLGRYRDTAAGDKEPRLLLYDSKDLVTHAVCVGMTGSGKTGLCIDLLEEAAIDGVPAIAIDPKGDIGNLLLQFPQLRPEDLKPWLDPADAERSHLSLDEFAAKQAGIWRNGLAEWGESPERIERLKQSADFAIYTPGSTAGLPLSVMKSFAPPADDAEDQEGLRDRISGTATAVLSLLGIAAEPMKSREHILLSNIFDRAWRDGRSLSLEELIGSIQKPPVDKIGVIDVDTFFPPGERFELAMKLNNLIASPGFETWLQGEPLDIERLLHTANGKPRVSILSIAHLSDTERMFFVTLVLNELLGWTRAQSGTTSLRAIFYMDEIFGYFPPVANPPSKKPLLTLLKQARAFGVSLVLATQNPVDLDYKGLANTGTWFIGRLQTERDRDRLVDGLQGAMNEAGAAFDRGAIEATLSGLPKRTFLMHDVHSDGPVVFESRWALSFLRGPLTRSQIRALTQARSPAAAAKEAKPAPVKRGSRPALTPDIPQAFLTVTGSPGQIIYQPSIYASCQMRFTDTKARIDFLREAAFLTPIHDDAVPVEWEECTEVHIDPNDLQRNPQDAGADFAPLPGMAAKEKSYAKWSKDLVTWIYGHQALTIYSSPALKLTSQPDETEGQFRARVQLANREQRDAAVDKLRSKYEARFNALENQRRRAEQSVEREREQARAATVTTAVDLGASVFGALFGRRRLVTAATAGMRSASRAYRQSGDVGRAEETLEAVTAQLRSLEDELNSEIRSIQNEADMSAAKVELVTIKPKKTNIEVRLLTLAWAPYRTEADNVMRPAWS